MLPSIHGKISVAWAATGEKKGPLISNSGP
jgi:hypothetical protein